MTVRSVWRVAAFCLAGASLGAQTSALTFHDLKLLPLLDLNSNIRIKKVIGEIGTFMLGEFSAGFKSNPHHHTYAQINIGLTGKFTLRIPVPDVCTLAVACQPCRPYVALAWPACQR